MIPYSVPRTDRLTNSLRICQGRQIISELLRSFQVTLIGWSSDQRRNIQFFLHIRFLLICCSRFRTRCWILLLRNAVDRGIILLYFFDLLHHFPLIYFILLVQLLIEIGVCVILKRVNRLLEHLDCFGLSQFLFALLEDLLTVCFSFDAWTSYMLHFLRFL